MSSTPYQTTSGSYYFDPGPRVIGASTDTLGFFGLATPVVKQGSSALATLSLGSITSSSPFGFASKADGDALVDQVKALTAALVAYGFIKQS